ncbi:hypothetical protein MYU51_012171 [Penicillium brevicompactum]
MIFSNSGMSRVLCGLVFIHSALALVASRPENGALQSRSNAICWSIIVTDSDTCETLSAKCGVTSNEFTTFNPAVSCSALPFGLPVCCSTGTQTLPPKGADSMCYDYTARDQLTCDQIAKAYNFSVADIESFNKDAWGWKGCGAIQEGSRMCLSSGLPPMPVAREGYVCGPQKPGTLPPLEWSQLSSLNPCPSGQCCSENGQCGTGADFCGSSTPATQQVAISSSKATSTQSETTTSKSSTAETAPTNTSHTTSKVTVTSTSSASATSHKSDKREVNLLDIPLTYYHPEEEMTATTTSSKSSTKTASSTSGTGSIETVEDGWSLVMYPEKDCVGSNYMLLRGYNKKLSDSACLVMPGWDINSISNDVDVSCRWWSEGGLTSAPCNATKLQQPNSWIMSNGLCTVVRNDGCDNYHDIGQTYGARGGGHCQNRLPTDPAPFGSMNCYVG